MNISSRLIRGIGARKPPLRRKPPLGFKIRQILTSPNLVFSSIFCSKFPMTWEKNSAAFGGRNFFELFDPKIAISKGKMVKTRFFLGPQNRFWRNLASDPPKIHRKPPLVSPYFEPKGGIPGYNTPDREHPDHRNPAKCWCFFFIKYL